MLHKDTKISGIIPVIGFGTWNIHGQKCIDSVQNAIETGYHHIDTAQIYNNEEEVGKGIKKTNIRRDNVFITTKISMNHLTPGRIESSVHQSLEKLNTGYVDLLLIHWPTPDMDLEACLEVMFKMKDDNYVKHVGVSNFEPKLFKKALQFGPVVTNQVKFSPLNGQFENLEIAKENNISLTAYSPLERGRLTNNKILNRIGKKYNKTASQVLLRWLIQWGNVSVIPKAASEKHRKENIDIFDFELSDEDVKEINEVGNR